MKRKKLEFKTFEQLHMWFCIKEHLEQSIEKSFDKEFGTRLDYHIKDLVGATKLEDITMIDKMVGV